MAFRLLILAVLGLGLGGVCAETVDKRFLNVPLAAEKDAEKSELNLMVDGKLVGHFSIPYAGKSPDFFGALDLSNYQGKTLELKDGDGKLSFSEVLLSDKVQGGDDLYDEKYRPQFHFSPRRGWLNDPNGMIYFGGKYHLFYQYNPFGVFWGNMSWGHATSTDMIHWVEEPTVLFPLPDTGMAYSGACFVDSENLMGFGTAEEPALIAFYLRTKEGLGYAYSTDGGKSFTDFEGNPVLTRPEGEEVPKKGRMDTPRPILMDDGKTWIAPTYDYFFREDGLPSHCVGFYKSTDLKDWSFVSRVPQDHWGDEMCGCVDFFELPVEGEDGISHWVMVFLDGSALIGNFDGERFTALDGSPAHVKDRARPHVEAWNFTATMTFADEPKGRRVQMTWMNNWEKNFDMPFSQQMTLPSELTLVRDGGELRLNYAPVREIESLRGEKKSVEKFSLGSNKWAFPDEIGREFEVELSFEAGGTGVLEMQFFDLPVKFDRASNTLEMWGLKSELKPVDGRIDLRVFVDRASIEIYAQGGQVYMPLAWPFKAEEKAVQLRSSEGEVQIERLDCYELKSIWPQVN